jgi:mannose-6-phosphate isomerase-like protein (cupin superfamily)
LPFETKRLPTAIDAVAPDGSDVRILVGLGRGSAAHFELGADETSVAIRHRTVDEIWFVLSGTGEMWRREGQLPGETIPLVPGTCLTIPLGTEFQFRCTSNEPLAAFGVTMPPWPGDGEAIRVEGPWAPTVRPGPGVADA